MLVEQKGRVEVPCPFCKEFVIVEEKHKDDQVYNVVMHTLPTCHVFDRWSADEFVERVYEKRYGARA